MRRERIPHPAFSTLSFPCPACAKPIGVWCKKSSWDNPICDARKDMYTKAYDRYIEKVEKGSIRINTAPFEEIEEQIQAIVQEVIDSTDNVPIIQKVI